MRRSDRFPASVPNLPSLETEVGKLEALRGKGVPNLPNLPNLNRARTHTSGRARVIARVYVRMSNHKKRLGRLGRLGSSSDCKGFGFPTSSKRLGKVGKQAGKQGGTAVEGVWISR